MANEKISQLPVASSSSNGDLYPIVQGGVNKSITFTALQSAIGAAAGITALTGDVLASGTGSVSSTVAFVGGASAANVATATAAYLAATNLNTPSTIVRRDGSGNFSAGTVTASFVGNLAGNASSATTSVSFSGSLAGDVTGSQGATVVSFVGGETASAIAASVVATVAATPSNTPSAIVKRDASGNFSASMITASLTGNVFGNVTGNVTGSAASFTTALGGDVTGNQSATVVAFVGGQSAAAVSAAAIAVASASSADTPSTLVFRDSSGNFAAGTITANLTGNASGTAANVTGVVAFANGGTGQTTQQSALNALAGAETNGFYLRGNGTNVVMSAIQVSDVPTLNQNTTGTAANVTAISNSTLVTLSALSLQGSQVTGNIAGTASNITATSNSTLTTLLSLSLPTSQLSGSVALTTQVSGVLPIANGGTNNSSAYIAGSIIFSNGTSLTQDNANFYWNDTTWNLGLGTIPATNVVIDVVNSTGSSKAIQSTAYGVGSSIPFRGRFARGTVGSPAAAQAGDALSTLSGRGYGASQFAAASTGAISIVAGETFSNTSNATYMQFLVTNTGSVTSNEAMRISPAGNLLIGTTIDDGTDKLQVLGNTTITGNETVTGNSSIATGAASIATIGGTSSTALHQMNGGINYTVKTITASTYTVDTTTTDYIIYTNSLSNAITITLPAPTKGRILRIYDLAGKAYINAVTIKQHASETINGLTQIVISNAFGGAELTTDGTNWEAVVVPTSGSLFITSGTTYTTPVNTTPQTRFKFTMVGGGGGGASTNSLAGGGAGGGGAAGIVLFISSLNANTGYTIAIGGGGAGSTSTGANGGNTTLTIGSTTYTAGGGTGAAALSASEGGAGGTATNGTITIAGQAGDAASGVATAQSGGGGSSPFGLGLGGGGVLGGTTNGNSGTGYGAGGGGAKGNGSPTSGSGTQGCILVEWWN